MTLLVTSLCAASLLGTLVAWLIWQQRGSGPDDTLGIAFGGLYLGIAAGLLGFFLSWFLVPRYLFPAYLRPVQIADGLVVLGWGIAGLMALSRQPQELNYDGHRPVLEVEVRADTTLLKGKAIQDAVEILYVGGQDFDYPTSAEVRKEGAFEVLPWATVPFEVKEWAVRVFLPDRPTWFSLALPKRPTQSTDWSGWIKPTPREDNTTPDGITLRYRFRLVPFSEM